MYVPWLEPGYRTSRLSQPRCLCFFFFKTKLILLKTILTYTQKSCSIEGVHGFIFGVSGYRVEREVRSTVPCIFAVRVRVRLRFMYRMYCRPVLERLPRSRTLLGNDMIASISKRYYNASTPASTESFASFSNEACVEVS